MGSNKNILIGQGGGPTNVINQSLVGIIKQEQSFKSKIFWGYQWCQRHY